MVLNLNNLLSSISRPSYLIIICSALYIFSLPPFGISFFYYLSFVIFFLNILKSDVFFKKKIFYFFLVTQLVTLSWIIQSFYSGGIGYLFLGIILVSILSLFIAFLHYSATILILTFYKQKLLLIFLLPLGLSIVELLKEFIFGGFPWNPSAIIYYKNIWILKTLPYLGVYGLGLVVHLIVGLMIYFLYYKNKFISTVLLALSIFFYFFGFIENNNIKKTEDETLDILLIQPNLYESLVEFDVLKNLEKYEQLTIEALSKSPKTDLIIWPEGSLPIDLNNRVGLLSRVSSLINEDQKIIVGSSAIEEDQLFNRLYVIDHQGKIIDFYDKQKLVLFGEYIPFIKPLVSKFLNLGMNYTPGHVQKTLNLPKDINAVPMICFESIFNYQSINKEICGSDMVIQISNDSWFGKWYGPHQHLANSLLRSVEFQKPLIRSTPSGITSIVDQSGKIIQTIASNKKGYLYYQHPITKNQSICSSTLKSVMVLLFLIFLFSFLYVRIKK